MALTVEQKTQRYLAGLSFDTESLDEGGPGSGHWRHKGRPGVVGGSAPGKADAGAWQAAGAAKAREILARKGVKIDGTATQRVWVYETLGRLPTSHLERSAIKSITLKETRQEVTAVYTKATRQSVPQGYGVSGYYWQHNGALVTEHRATVLLHEFGHSLQRAAGQAVAEVWYGSGRAGSVTQYGTTDPHEAFADGYMLHATNRAQRLAQRAPAIAEVYKKFFA